MFETTRSPLQEAYLENRPTYPIIRSTVEIFQKEGTHGDGNASKAPACIEEYALIDAKVETYLKILNSIMGINDRSEANILSSGQSPGVGHWGKSKSKYSMALERKTQQCVVL